MTPEEAQRTQKPYRYGMILLCFGALINWIGLAENYTDPFRYAGVACIIGGAFLICTAMCCWLHVPNRSAVGVSEVIIFKFFMNIASSPFFVALVVFYFYFCYCSLEIWKKNNGRVFIFFDGHLLFNTTYEHKPMKCSLQQFKTINRQALNFKNKNC